MMNNFDVKSFGIVNARVILDKALKNHYAIAHINANNLEWIKSTIEVAVETNSPVIIGFSMAAVKYIGGYKCCVDICVDIAEELNKIKKIPIVIHLDHGNYEACKEAINAGFTSIMFDGSSLPFEENLTKTKDLLVLANKNDVSFEAELGAIGSNLADGELADIEECKIFANLGITCLAIGIGNIHGIYPDDWKGLNFALLNDIHHATMNMPLVLHGGTGISDEQIQKSISLGIAKININTECQLAFAKAIRKYIESEYDLDLVKKGYDPRKILTFGANAIKETIIEKLKLFGSYGVNK